MTVSMDSYQKIHIKSINEGMLKDTYLLTKGKRAIRRARVLGSIVGKYKNEDGSFSSITLDDGSDTIRVKAFREDVPKLDPFDMGQDVDVFGRVREYEEERYLIPDLLHKVDNPNLSLLRKTELQKIALDQQKKIKEFKKTGGKGMSEEDLLGFEEQEEKVEEESIEETVEEKSKKPSGELVLTKITELDKGEGVDYESLIKSTGLQSEELEDTLTSLLGKGDVYEPKSGKFKRLA